MGAAVQPEPASPFDDLTQLSLRIARHLKANPHDTQAQDDLRYVTSQMGGPQGAAAAANAQDQAEASGPPAPADIGAARGAGLADAALDIPRGIANTVLHPFQTADAINSMNPLDPRTLASIGDALRDPDLNLAGKADAIIRHTPLNLGYGPESALMEATGATGEPPASVEEQWHRGGNVASLALLGLNKNTPGVGLASRVAGRLPIVGPMTRAVGDLLQRYGQPAKVAEGSQADLEAQLGGGPNRPPPALPSSDALRATRDYSAGKISGQDLSDALGFARHGPAAFTEPPAAGAFAEPSAQAPPVVQPAALAGVPPTKAPIGSVPSTAAQSAPDALRGLSDAQLEAQPGGATPPLTASATAPGAIEGQALAATRRAMTPPEGTPAPAAAAGKQVANSYADLQRLLRQGVPREQIQVGYYTRGGAAEQSIPPVPRGSAAPAAEAPPDVQGMLNEATPMQLRRALGKVHDPASRQMIQDELTRRTNDLVKQGSASYSGGVKGVASALSHPAYQRASILAGRILDSPDLLIKYPQFAGQTAEQATQTLRGMLIKQAEAGQAIPPITSLGKFLERLAP